MSAEDHTTPPAPERQPALGGEDVRHLAQLARLDLTDDEVTLFAGQLGIILSAVARVGEVAAAAHEGLIPKLGIERVDGEPVIGSGLEETLVAAGFSRQPRRLVASA